jgi:pyruvate-formate lyase-activating enzyme
MDGVKHGYDCSSEKSVKGITFLGGDLVIFHEYVVDSMI